MHILSTFFLIHEKQPGILLLPCYSRAEMLLDQYRKKAELFQTRNLLVPLGDDFRYDKELEIARQFSHYNKIISYINSHPEMRARVSYVLISQYRARQ